MPRSVTSRIVLSTVVLMSTRTIANNIIANDKLVVVNILLILSQKFIRPNSVKSLNISFGIDP